MILKNKYILFGIFITGSLSFLAILAGFRTYPNHKNESVEMDNPPAIRVIDYSYIADYADDRILMGASHNVFVGTVISQVSAQDFGLGPETQFAVRIISNIKGSLGGIVTVNQEGGYANGVLYVAGDNNDALKYLLQPRSTYLFTTRYSSTHDWYTLNPFPTASKLIERNSTVSDAELQRLVANDVRVKQLQAAYPHEILLKADIEHNNTRNSHDSLLLEPINSSSSVGTNSLQANTTTTFAVLSSDILSAASSSEIASSTPQSDSSTDQTASTTDASSSVPSDVATSSAQ